MGCAARGSGNAGTSSTSTSGICWRSAGAAAGNHGRAGPRIVIAIDGLVAVRRLKLGPLPCAERDETGAGQVGRGLHHLFGRRRGIDLQNLICVVAIEPPDGGSKTLNGGFVLPEDSASALFCRVTSGKERHLRLLARLEDLHKRLRQEVAVEIRTEGYRRRPSRRTRAAPARGSGEFHDFLRAERT